METMFWKRLTDLCEARRTTPTAVCKASGLATGNVTYWKQGRLPNQKAINVIAEYFNVDPKYFVTETEKAPDAEAAGAISKEQLKFALFGENGGVVSDEKLAEVLRYASYIKDV